MGEKQVSIVFISLFQTSSCAVLRSCYDCCAVQILQHDVADMLVKIHGSIGKCREDNDLPVSGLSDGSLSRRRTEAPAVYCRAPA